MIIFCLLIRFKSCGAFKPSCSRTLACKSDISINKLKLDLAGISRHKLPNWQWTPTHFSIHGKDKICIRQIGKERVPANSPAGTL